MKKLIWFFGIVFLMITGCDKYSDLPPVISVSVSSDGKYAVAVHDDKDSKDVPHSGTLILWDIENQTNQILAKNANVFSVAFVPDSHEFIWQDDEDIVHIQTVEGKKIKQFKNFTTYGQIIDKAKSLYLASDSDFHILSGEGENQEKVKFDAKAPSFLGIGKVLNLSQGGDYFVSAGDGANGKVYLELEGNLPVLPKDELKVFSEFTGVVLWNKTTLKPLAKLNGNVSKTTARISPDGKWVVGGDEGGGHYLWSTTPPYSRTQLYDTDGGLLAAAAVHSIVFLDHGNDFAVFYHDWEGSHNPVGIFKTGEERAKEFVYLPEKPRPCVAYYQRNLCIASAPDANIIVTGQEDHGGINVYKFHPETLTLEPVWIAK